MSEWGSGEPALLVHGSFGFGEEQWNKQRSLAERWRLQLVDRCGHGRSPDTGRFGWDEQSADIADLLGGGAHLIGQSYGGTVALLAALRRPMAVRSLTLVEPNTLGVVRDNLDAAALIERVSRVLSVADMPDPPTAYAAFMGAFGFQADSHQLTEMDLRCIRASIREPPPWEANVPALRPQVFPVLIVLGGWPSEDELVRSTGRAFAAIGRRLADGLGGELVTFPKAFHNPQLLGGPFNQRWEAFLKSSSPQPASP